MMIKRQILITLSILLTIQTSAAARDWPVPTQDHPTIQSVIDDIAVVDGDVVVVKPGTYTGPGNVDIDFVGKAITVRSWINPDNPNWDIIAATIIDCQGNRYAPHRAFHFDSGEDNNSRVLGFTIINGYHRGPAGANGAFGYSGVPTQWYVTYQLWLDPEDPCNTPPRALPGEVGSGNGYGGAILCENASPTIKYCVIRNCTVTGGQGGDGARGQDGPWEYLPFYDWTDPCELPPELVEEDNAQWGGHGADGFGDGHGGAIACRNVSNPLISDCIIRDNFARGGCGGNGGDGGWGAEPPDYSDGAVGGSGRGGNGYGDGMGGAIYCDGSSDPIIADCSFINNIAATGIRSVAGQIGLLGDEYPDDPPQPLDGSDPFYFGQLLFSSGGIAGGAGYYNSNSDLNFTNCTFTGSKAYEAYYYYDPILGEDIMTYTIGGALYSGASNFVTLDTCEFTGNLAGALYCGSDCTVTINNNYDPSRNCLFTNNSEISNGGAVYIGPDGSAQIRNCIFGGNSAYNDGGALESESHIMLENCSFGDNIAGSGFGGGVNIYRSDTLLLIDVDNCSFSGNQARYGGGFASENFYADFTDCYFVDNTAQDGGGLDLVNGDVHITGSVVTGNNATDGEGGGLNCNNTVTEILHCTISDNSAGGVYPTGGFGGGINFYGWVSTHRVFNCLITGNSASVGGAICCFGTTPDVSNCTFSDNLAGDYGGAIFSDWSSLPEITDCIFQNNNSHAIHEDAYGGDAIVTYSLFYDNPDGDYYDSDTGLQTGADNINNNVAGAHDNIDGDPLFVSGPLGEFYLRQQPVQPLPQSPAVDTGSVMAASLGLDSYTTRTDHVGDTGQVDMGYHYIADISVIDTFQLTASVVDGNGTVEPTAPEAIDYDPVTDTYTYYAGTTVTITATPQSGWQVRAWSGTDNDSSTATTNSVVMTLDRTVRVEFEQPRTLLVAVGGGEPGFYANIQDALHDANDGDTIVVFPGTYYGGYFGDVAVVNKAVTIRSKHPDDPCCVATTIIDGYNGYQFNEGYNNNGFVFQPTPGGTAVLNGFTIQNCGGWAGPADDGDRDEGHPDGYDAGCLEGAAINISSGAGVVIKNCVIRDNHLIGGNGGDGEDSDSDYNAGRGGWSGWAHGAGVYCGTFSSAKFINCRIINNQALGGDGGDGGSQSDEDDGLPNYGGNWSRAEAFHIDPFGLFTIVYVDGDLWEYWQWDRAFAFLPRYGYPPDRTCYFGDYRWYGGFGGGAYCDVGSNVTFTGCEIRENLAFGGMSGQGGIEWPSERPFEPLIPYRIPSFGGGVYCAADSNIAFTDCTITDNMSYDSNDPNHRLDPYLGHGGGVCAEDTAALIFTGCTFSDNNSCAGGGLHFGNANVTISDCDFISNLAFHGGGVFGEHGPTTMIRCDIIDNRAFPEVNDYNIYEGVLGDGGGLHLWATDADIIDCSISGNQAETSGGGVYFGGENAQSLTNCLLTNNTAGRDGGGVSANIFSQLTISNCTIVDNNVTGIGFEDDYGGGLSCSYESYTDVIDSIIWGNSAHIGSQVAVGTGFEYDLAPSTLRVSYSDVEGWQDANYPIWVDPNAVFVDVNSILDWDFSSNIDEDPNFVTGPLGGHYLSQIAAGQLEDSPCVDTGSATAVSLGLDSYTTRIDHAGDTGQVDMGYHYIVTAAPCKLCDLVYDGIIKFSDFAMFALHWLTENCSDANDWCQGADLTLDTYVDFSDLASFVECWLVEDTSAPIPDPSRWEIEPYSTSMTSIAMTAKAAVDTWGWDVEYYFKCVYGDGHDSSWQDSPAYEDTDLVPNEYGYRVRARDEMGNNTDWSAIRYATIEGGVTDLTPPSPDPMTWAEEPNAVSESSISMTATTANDVSGVEYYFECTSGECNDSGWQDEPSYTDVNLVAGTEYCYTVMARDKSVNQNGTGLSDPPACATTFGVQNQVAPTPDPMVWDPIVDSNGFDGTPREIHLPPYDNWSWSVTMRAAEAIDDEALVVEYKFICTTNSTYSSGNTGDPDGLEWRTDQTYTVPVGQQGQMHCFRVMARDPYDNRTVASDPPECTPPPP